MSYEAIISETSIQVDGNVSDVHQGETRLFSVTITEDDVAVDISGDTVTSRIKRRRGDLDSEALLDVDADVGENGANGQADFTWSTTDTDINPGNYYIDIVWELAGGEKYVVYDSAIKVLERVSDA